MAGIVQRLSRTGLMVWNPGLAAGAVFAPELGCLSGALFAHISRKTALRPSLLAGTEEKADLEAHLESHTLIERDRENAGRSLLI